MQETGKVHLIGIGMSAMADLALSLKSIGLLVTGSDEHFSDQENLKLKNASLLPDSIGWYPERINKHLDAVILSIGVNEKNPELIRAEEIGLRVYTLPQFIYHLSEDKQRIVIGGSHGKTTIASMILHVLEFHNRKFDFIVGAQIEPFNSTIRLSDDAPLIVIEADETVSSTEQSSSFLHYNHHIALVSGIAWDHINMFPTFEDYVKQYEILADATPKGGVLIYNEEDDLVTVIGRKERDDVQRIEYKTPKFKIQNGKTFVESEEGEFELNVIGKHNLSNLNGAKAICQKIGITNSMFFDAIKSFKGAGPFQISEKSIVFTEYGQSPSKIKAAACALKEQFPKKEMVLLLELSSIETLSNDYLPQFKDCLETADSPILFYNTPGQDISVTEAEIKDSFNHPNLKVFTEKAPVEKVLKEVNWDNKIMLFISSPAFSNFNIKELAAKVITHQ